MIHCNINLQRVRHVLLDMDGTIYLGSKLFEWTLPFLQFLKSHSIDYSFFTNNTSLSRTEYFQKLKRLGIEIHPDKILTPTYILVNYLQAHHPQITHLFVLGSPSFQSELAALGFTLASCDSNDEPDAVVVSFDTALRYERLCQAAWWIKQEKFYIATHPDRICPTNKSIVLVDCGAICSALESAIGIMPHHIVGKPNPLIIDQLCESLNLHPEELVVIGDRLMTDIALATNGGAQSILVLSGEATRQEAEHSRWVPDLIVENLSELPPLF